MELIRGAHNLRQRHRGCVATIGNFDGVHLGHQAVLDQLLAARDTHALPAALILFEPQPTEFFNPRGAPARLMRLREKLDAIAAHGVDRVLCLHFDERLASEEPERFIERVLVEGLGVRHLVVGDDFRFGRHRRGDFAMLRAAGAAHGFAVAETGTWRLDGERVSSGRVRERLAAGDMAGARRLLGRHYFISGHVAGGHRRGRDWGFPTANVHLLRRRVPVHGIFAVEVHGIDNRSLRGAASVGTRPVVDGKNWLLEVHLLDFRGDIYGRLIRVDFLHKLREERNFPSVTALRRQIAADIEDIRRYFAERDSGSAQRLNAK